MAKNKKPNFPKRKPKRVEQGTFLYGFHVLEAALQESSVVKSIFIMRNLGNKTNKLQALAQKKGVTIINGDEPQLSQLIKEQAISLDEFSDATNFQDKVARVISVSRGVIGLASSLERLAKTETELYNSVDVSTTPKPFYLVLDKIEDPHNLGAIIRIADQFSASGIVIARAHRPPLNNTIAKTSSGGIFTVPIYEVGNLNRCLEQLKSKGCWIYGAEMSGKQAHLIQFTEPTVLVMGSEGKGLSSAIRMNCDELISIPTKGKLDSLNVSVATGILSYEIRRNDFKE
jgi:23S rRNA (guanosine2251-2'-O)-methyltransferase